MKQHTKLKLLFLCTIISLYSWVTASDVLPTPHLSTITQKNITTIWEEVFDTKKFTLKLELDTLDNKEAFLSGKIYLENPENFFAGQVEIKFSHKDGSVELQWLRIHQDMRSKKIGSLCIEALKKTCLHLGYEIITLEAKFIDHSDTEDVLIDNQKIHALSYCKTLQFYARHNAVRMPQSLQKTNGTQHILDTDIRNCCVPLHTDYQTSVCLY